jgi:predicted small metal-binding protein
VKELSCGEAGFDCDYISKGRPKKLLRKAAEEAMMDHGI